MKEIWLLLVLAFVVCVVASPFDLTGDGLARVSDVSFDASRSPYGTGWRGGSGFVPFLQRPFVEAIATLDAALAH